MADMTMSLDGFVADPHDGVEHLFGWYFNGPVAIPSKADRLTFQVSEASAPHLREAFEHLGALVVGRRLFDLTDGWSGRHPMGVPVIVVTHTVPDDWPHDDAPFTFVTEGVGRAIEVAKAIAGDRKWVGIGGTTVAQQCLDLGLLDEIRVALVPVLLGEGIPWFANLKSTPVELGDPRIIAGTGVTHLYCPVRSAG
ncbi:dihydrofolate reductase family protein [Dactylosporangium fulvum]|uniref:dihydrofolate reductase family protein n=1 Tax=Dactylosporangium fulvum TaxID=53359 RepID=UPI0038737342